MVGSVERTKKTKESGEHQMENNSGGLQMEKFSGGQ